MVYSEVTRQRFDAFTQRDLDTLRDRFGEVEVIPPAETLRDRRWFVQIRKDAESSPMGAFGNSPGSAAQRLLKILTFFEE